MKNNILAKHRVAVPLLLLLMLLAVPAAGFAQKFEINPYAGGFFPGKWADVNEFKNRGLWGAKGGFFLTDKIEVEGNFGYINHFDLVGNDTKTRGIVWDANGSYNFPRQFGRWRPFATFGLGGLTANTSGASAAFTPAVTVKDGATFLALNYGGGMKALRLWGPMGVRADVRGRTLPNVYGRGTSWLEVAGGLTFSWGER